MENIKSPIYRSVFSFVLCLCLSYSTGLLRGQTVDLIEAQKLYDEGHCQQALERLTPVLERDPKGAKLNTEQLEIAYRLTVMSYLCDNDSTSAQTYLQMLIDLNPYYREKQEGELEEELKQQYVKFRSHPTLQVSLHAGVNWTDVLTSPRQYGVDQTDTDRDYTAELGFHPIGIEVERPLIQHTTDWQTYLKRKRQYFSLGVGLQLTQRRFSISHQYATENFPYPVAEFNLFSGIERDQWVALSPYVRYQQYNRDKTFGFYSKAGTGFHYLLRSHLVQVDRNTQVSPQPNVASTALQLTQDKIDLLAEEFHLRQRFNFSLQLGGGIFWRLLSSPHYLMIGADYQFFRRHLDLSNERYQNPRLLYDFGYVDDALFIHSFHLKAGVQFQLFSPQKM